MKKIENWKNKNEWKWTIPVLVGTTQVSSLCNFYIRCALCVKFLFNQTVTVELVLAWKIMDACRLLRKYFINCLFVNMLKMKIKWILLFSSFKNSSHVFFLLPGIANECSLFGKYHMALYLPPYIRFYQKPKKSNVPKKVTHFFAKKSVECTTVWGFTYFVKIKKNLQLNKRL